MKFQVERDVLADAVAWTARALPARPAVPVLAGMHLAAGPQLTLSTFDYEVSAQASVPVITDEEGTVLVSGRLLAEIVRSLPARPVEMSTEGTRTTLKCGSAVFTLMTLPDDEYPTLPGMPPEAGAIGADVLASAIGQVAIAAGRDDTLPALTGIRMELEGDTVNLVATDRYRLAVRELHWQPAKPDTSAAVLVPARVLVDAARSLTTAAEVAIALAPPGEDGAHGEGIIGFEGGGHFEAADDHMVCVRQLNQSFESLFAHLRDLPLGVVTKLEQHQRRPLVVGEAPDVVEQLAQLLTAPDLIGHV